MSTRKTLGLVLGCGASRGWAHIGVIEALEEANIPIDFIAGCSVGAYIGAVYASGGMHRFKDFLLRMNGKKIFSYVDVSLSRSGLLNGTKRLNDLFSMHTDAKSFEELDIPLVMVATDLKRGEKVILKAGSLVDALRATMSYPGLFSPVNIDGCWLVDGGVIDPVPVGVARAMGADVIVAVDLNARIVSHNRNVLSSPPDEENSSRPLKPANQKAPTQNIIVRKMSEYFGYIESDFRGRGKSIRQIDPSTPDIIEAITAAIGIMEERITRINLAVDRPDILIQPRLGEMKMMNFDQVSHAIEEGYLGTQEKIIDILTRLK